MLNSSQNSSMNRPFLRWTLLLLLIAMAGHAHRGGMKGLPLETTATERAFCAAIVTAVLANRIRPCSFHGLIVAGLSGIAAAFAAWDPVAVPYCGTLGFLVGLVVWSWKRLWAPRLSQSTPRTFAD